MAHLACIFGCESSELSKEEYRFFESADPWGFILFARNIESPDQVCALTDQLRAAVGRAAPVLIDQEGGRVQRLRAPHWREYPPALDQMTAAGVNAGHAMYLRNRLIADELHAVGIDVNCAPLADVIRPESHRVLKNRCYGATPEIVIEMCREAARGLLDGGVLPVLKHIPGYGRAVVDGHLELPRVDVPKPLLEEVDFAPFRALNDFRMGMTAHIVFSTLDKLAATVSPKMVGLIRGEIGFDGLLMTDDISMEALKGSVEDRARASLEAGCDIVLHCNGDMAEMEKIAANCGQLTAEALARAEHALAQRRPPEEIDIPAAIHEFQALIGG